ncbi:hypothetical protein QP860_03455 [Aerococcus sp. UMB1112A]|uniref:hypothetical protein n=1 Tax=Aerococcus sp. UMB1112A TaxID=3050609 RepID=UPI00254C7BCB|nr:hypothetical protein [Aerococcus sp. UMB1112A]MDK8502105.1 hypothetical protein [Aerococcus sp. UMB1112A]
MDRKFLKQFGLNDKAIGQILGEYHNSLSQAKEDLEAGYLEEMNALKDTIAEQGGET